MPAFATVAGIDLEILVAGASEQEGDVVGTAARSFSGELRSSKRVWKRQWRWTVRPILQTDYNTFRAAVQTNGGIVTCTGEALDNASIDCLVTIGNADFVQDGTSFLRTVDLTLDEV